MDSAPNEARAEVGIFLMPKKDSLSSESLLFEGPEHHERLSSFVGY